MSKYPRAAFLLCFSLRMEHRRSSRERHGHLWRADQKGPDILRMLNPSALRRSSLRPALARRGRHEDHHFPRGGSPPHPCPPRVGPARRTIAGQVLRTPMLPAPKLSVLTGAEVYVKYENLQVTNSFKDRGALNKLASLSPSARERGVIAMSAGNHAQAVAYHAARLAI